MSSWNGTAIANCSTCPHVLESPFPRSMVLPASPSLQGSAPAVKAATRLLGVSPSLVYAYVERRQIPHYRMMGRSIRFRLSELVERRQQFHVNDGGIDEQNR